MVTGYFVDSHAVSGFVTTESFLGSWIRTGRLNGNELTKILLNVILRPELNYLLFLHLLAATPLFELWPLLLRNRCKSLLSQAEVHLQRE